MEKNSTRICFIVNPAANRNRSVQYIDWLSKEAHKLWETVEIIITRKDQNIADLSRKKARNFDVIVACGGDGTVHEVVNGIAETNASLGVLPIGSGNDFVKSLGLDKTASECLNILHTQNTTKIDLIQYSGDASGWCVNTMGFGLDGWANYYAHKTKKLKGGLIYIYGALKAALTFRGSAIHLKIDDAEFKSKYLMITACNGKWEGGNFYVAPKADMCDGLLDILTIEKISVLRILTYLPRFYKGPSPTMKGVKTVRCKKLSYKSNIPVAVHADGEQVGTSIRHLNLTVRNRKLSVIVP